MKRRKVSEAEIPEVADAVVELGAAHESLGEARARGESVKGYERATRDAKLKLYKLILAGPA